MQDRRRTLGVRVMLLIAACTIASAAAGGPALTASFGTPSLDRWMYSFNSTPGTRTAMSTFGEIGTVIPGFNFDDRMAQCLVGFDLPSQVTPGRGACGYRVLATTLRISVSIDGAFAYDPTYDPWTSYGVADDGDGRPLELHGAGFRNGFTAATFLEGSAFRTGSGGNEEGQRNAFATDFLGRTARDVSNNIRDGFDPTAWAIGQITGVAPGAPVPVDSQVVFTLNVNEPDVQEYLRRALDSGLLRLMISSLQPATTGGPQPGAGAYATFYTKEALGAEGLWASLELQYRLIPPGDADGNGVVNFADITAVLTSFGQASVNGDANCDGAVNFADVTAVLTSFGASAP